MDRTFRGLVDVVAVFLTKHVSLRTPGTPCYYRLSLYHTRALYGSWTHNPLTITPTPAERRTLRAWQRATTLCAGLLRRARIIILVAEGRPVTAIAATVGISRRFVYKWVQRFLTQGVEGLADKPGRGRVPPQAAPQEQHDMDVG